jgi:hypothetical protein
MLASNKANLIASKLSAGDAPAIGFTVTLAGMVHRSGTVGQ